MRIGHFRVARRFHFKVRLSAMPWILKTSFYSHGRKIHFARNVLSIASFSKWECLELANGFALSLALKQRLWVTRKWPIYVIAQIRVRASHDWLSCWIGVFEEMCHERIFPRVQCNILYRRHHREDYLYNWFSIFAKLPYTLRRIPVFFYHSLCCH